jgi:hypothetical protein
VARLSKEIAAHAAAPNPFSSYVFFNRTRREIALSPYSILSEIGTVHSPYLDHDVFDLLLSLPGRMFLDHKFHSDAIDRAFPEYAGVPYSISGNAPIQPLTLTSKRRWRRFAWDVLRYCCAGTSLLSKGYFLPRLLRCLCDDNYLPSIRWLGPPAVYLFQLELFWKHRRDPLSRLWSKRIQLLEH